MPKLTQRERRQKKATPGCECGICLENIKPRDQLRLPCGHTYHETCLGKWGSRKTPDGVIDVMCPFGGKRKIALFNKDTNIFTCPTCRTEYTHDVFDDFKINKVLAKIHLIYKDEPVVQYVTNPLQTMAYVPFEDLIENETKINKKWVIQLALLKKAWERGDTDIYAAKRLSPEPEFVLTNDHFKLCPLNKDGSAKPITNGTLMSYELVSVEQLVSILS